MKLDCTQALWRYFDDIQGASYAAGMSDETATNLLSVPALVDKAKGTPVGTHEKNAPRLLGAQTDCLMLLDATP